MSAQEGRMPDMARSSILKAVESGLRALKRHKLWTAAGGLGFLGVMGLIADLFGVFGLMQSLLAAQWFQALLASPIFKVAGLIVVAVAIWRIGALTLKEERARTVARIAAENDAAARTLEAQEALFERAAEEQQSRIAEALVISGMLSRAHLLQQSVRNMQAPLVEARSAVSEYAQTVADIEAGKYEYGPGRVEMSLRHKLERVSHSLSEASRAIAGEGWPSNRFDGLPALEITQVDEEKFAFESEKNLMFLHAHRENRRQLQQLVADYGKKIAALQDEANHIIRDDISDAIAKFQR
jgi:hypothetical protein